MGLYLKVLHIGDEPIDYDLSAVISTAQGSIGRATDNDLVLPDNDGVISRKHAKIEIQGQRAFITDSSVNGTLLLEPIIDDPEDALNEIYLHRETSELVDGSYLIIGDFEIQVQFVEQPEVVNKIPVVEQPSTLVENIIPTIPDAAPHQPDDYIPQSSANVSALNDHFSMPESKPAEQPEIVKTDQNSIPEELNIDDFFADDVPSIPPDPSALAEEDIFASLDDSLIAPQPPAEEKPGIVIPDMENAVSEGLDNNIPTKNIASVASATDDLLTGKTEVILPITTSKDDVLDANREVQNNLSPLTDSRPMSMTILENTFFRGLGIAQDKLPDNQEEIETLLFNAGKILKNLLDSQASLLKARAEIKKQFAASMTVIQREENNPLKFCQSTDELVDYLFINTPPGFLSAEQAVNESIDDLCHHQMAMMAGIQAALKGLLDKFSPEMVEKNCDPGRFNKASKYWEYYLNHYSQISQIAQTEFLGSDFAEAYESQVKSMKKRNRID